MESSTIDLLGQGHVQPAAFVLQNHDAKPCGSVIDGLRTFLVRTTS